MAQSSDPVDDGWDETDDAKRVEMVPATDDAGCPAPVDDGWDEDDRISVEELARGEGRRFDEPADAVRWLSTPEETAGGM